ncbi:MAG: ATP F0F1 synthase subunit B [Alphaproteobacteria bacterium]|nr:ATP F0F1 synthase subunit B [Alphaproteobacteria bacterium]
MDFGHLGDATSVALLALIGFGLLLWRLNVPGMLTGALDKRSQEIALELTEARRLREEAAALLHEYEAKKAAALAEAEALVASAKEQAQVVAQETRKQIEDQMARREQQAKDRIALAEAQAERDVRAAAIDAATEAAERMLRERIDAAAQSRLIADGVKDLEKRFA